MNPSRVEQSLGQVLDFMRLLWAVDHGLSTASKSMNRKLGVTGPQRLVIRIVGRYPGLSAGELASILHLHPSSLTGVLKRLVSMGLLTRNTAAEDARRAILTLTAKGRALDGLTTGTVESSIQTALKTIDARSVATAESVLRAVADALLHP